MGKRPLNIGFISFRFEGTDGVSLETSKWAKVLERMGHKCFYFSGDSDRGDDISYTVDEANYQHPEIVEKHHQFWANTKRSHEDTLWIKEKTEFFHGHLRKFVDQFNIDLFIPQNMFSYPLNIPLTLAVTEYIAENNFQTIAHNHDFYWERKIFYVNSVWDYITMAFPPTLSAIQHAVINSSAKHQLARRRGRPSVLIPNVMDFATPAPVPDDYSKDIRKELGVADDEKLILQPTRVVQRKGIEHAIELVSRMNIKHKMIIPHSVTDDEVGYVGRIKKFAEMMNVNLLFFPDRFDENRGTNEKGEKVYSLWDLYPHADLITYPSVFEGFGNAFLEAILFKKPIVVNNYSIYEMDIRTKGFKVVFFDDFITDKTVTESLKVLEDKKMADDWAEENYKIALRYYSFERLETLLNDMIENVYVELEG
jgi:glycosyltransferase involved in cell wall biosynthesis